MGSSSTATHGRGEFVASALAGDVASGRIRDDVDFEQVATEVLATLIGLEIQWWMDPERVDYIAAVERYATGLLERFAPRPS